MFECKVCAEKDNRIADLLAQVDTLTRLVFPAPVSTRHLPVIDLDAAVSPTPFHEELGYESEDALREADRILSGNY